MPSDRMANSTDCGSERKKKSLQGSQQGRVAGPLVIQDLTSLVRTAGNLCAPEVVLAASRLEALGHLGALQDAPPIYAHLEQEVLRLVQALGPFRRGYLPVTQAA